MEHRHHAHHETRLETLYMSRSYLTAHCHHILMINTHATHTLTRHTQALPATDLSTMERLWLQFSDGQYGYSIQKRVWDIEGGNFERFIRRIGWTRMDDGEERLLKWFTKPREFNYSPKTAPKGHLPLTAALRGTQVRAIPTASLLTPSLHQLTSLTPSLTSSCHAAPHRTTYSSCERSWNTQCGSNTTGKTTSLSTGHLLSRSPRLRAQGMGSGWVWCMWSYESGAGTSST